MSDKKKAKRVSQSSVMKDILKRKSIPKDEAIMGEVKKKTGKVMSKSGLSWYKSQARHGRLSGVPKKAIPGSRKGK